MTLQLTTRQPVRRAAAVQEGPRHQPAPGAPGGGPSRRRLFVGLAGRFVGLVVLIVTVLELFGAALQPTWPGSSFSWDGVTPAPEYLAKDVRLTLWVANQRIRASYRLTLPLEQGAGQEKRGLLWPIQQDEGAQKLQGLVALLGQVEVDDEKLSFIAPEVTIRKGERDATVLLRSKPQRLRFPQPHVEVAASTARCPLPVRTVKETETPKGQEMVGCLPPARVMVKTKRAKVISAATSVAQSNAGTYRRQDALPPVAQSNASTTYQLQDSLTPLDLHLLLDPFTPPPRRSGAKTPDPDRATVAYWNDLAVQGLREQPGKARLTLHVEQQNLTARYDLTLPRKPGTTPRWPHSYLFNAIELGRAAQDPQGLVALLGLITVDDEALRFRAPTITVGDGDRDGRVVVSSEPLSLRDERPHVIVHAPKLADCCLPAFPVLLETRDAQVTWSSWDLVQQSAGHAVYRLPSGVRRSTEPAQRDLEMGLLLTPFDSSKVPREPVGWALRRIGDASVPGFGWLVYWCTVSLPLLLFLAWRRPGHRLGNQTAIEPAASVVRDLLLFYVVLTVVSALASLTARWSHAVPVAEALRSLGWWPSGRPDGSGASGLLLLGAFIWPALLAVPRLPPATRRRRRVLQAIVGGLAAAGLVGLVTSIVVIIQPGIERSSVPLLEALIWIVGAAVALALILKWLFDPLAVTPPVWLRVGAVAAPLALEAVDSYRSEESRLADFVVYGIVIMGGVLILGTLLHVAARALTNLSWIPPGPRVFQRGLRKLAGSGQAADQHGFAMWLPWLFTVVLLTLFAVPLSHSADLRASGWDLLQLSVWVRLLIAMVVASVIVDALRRSWPDGRSPLNEHVRWLGVLLVLVVLFEPASRFLYVPVPFITAFVLVAFWLLKSPASHNSEVDVLQGAASRTRLVDTAVKASKQKQSDPVRSLVLMMGPTDSPWKNGKLFAGFSLLLSAPWILLAFLPSELDVALERRRYLPLTLLVLIIWNVVRWAVLGFVLGFFYRVVPGRNGLWKGLAVAVAVIAPWLLLNLAYWSIDDNNAWKAFAVWALQVFVTSVLTGFLAGELKTLWLAGRGWRELMLLHDFRTLAAWGSSVLIASGGALITLLTTTVGQLLVQAPSGPSTPSGGP